MAKDVLVFDTSDAQSILDSDHVGSHTLSGSGSLITSGDGNADDLTPTSMEALDVRNFNYVYDATNDDWDRLRSTNGAVHVFIDDGDFTVDTKVDGVYNGVSNTDPDNTGLIAHIRGAAPDDTSQTFRSTGANPNADNVDPANVFALDVNSFGMAWDGAAWDRLTSSGGALDVNLASQDATITVSDAALANTAIANAANTLDVADTAESVVASALANRKYLWTYNKSNKQIFIGSASVTEANGFPISPGSYMEMRAGAAVDVKFVGRAGELPEIRTLELS